MPREKVKSDRDFDVEVTIEPDGTEVSRIVPKKSKKPVVDPNSQPSEESDKVQSE